MPMRQQRWRPLSVLPEEMTRDIFFRMQKLQRGWVYHLQSTFARAEILGDPHRRIWEQQDESLEAFEKRVEAEGRLCPRPDLLASVRRTPRAKLAAIAIGSQVAQKDEARRIAVNIAKLPDLRKRAEP
jgi:hypothetical protein